MSRAPGGCPGVVRKHRRRLRPDALLGLCLIVGAAGCAGDGPPPVSGGTYDAIQSGIFNVHCLGSGCHDIASQSGGLVLEAGLSYDNLVNVVPDNATADALGLLRVEPFNPDGSFLLIKLTDPGGGEGARMPRGMNPLSAADITEIRNWILSGAPPPGTRTPLATGASSPTPTPSPSPAPSAGVGA